MFNRYKGVKTLGMMAIGNGEKCPFCKNVGEFFQVLSDKLCCAKCKRIIGVEFV